MTHGFEEHPYAFYLCCGGMIACTSTLFTVLYGRYRLLDSDTSEARMRHYYALKNYLVVLDEVEARLKINEANYIGPESNYVTKQEFGNVLKSVVNAQQDEIDLIFKSFDANRSGVLEMDELTDDVESKPENGNGSRKSVFGRRGLFQRKFRKHKEEGF